MRNYITLYAALVVLSASPLMAEEVRRDPKNYSQWKEALNTSTAVDPKTITVSEGYAVELLHSATKEEGTSWISLAFNAQGELYIGREDKGILRLSMPKMPPNRLAGDVVLKKIKLQVADDKLLEPRGLLCVGKDLYVNANNSKGLYRLRDVDGDGLFEEATLLRATPGDVGHGRNDLTLGPDGNIYLIHGNDTRLPEDFAQGTSAYRNYDRDRLLPCEWNKNLFNYGVTAPAGHVIKTDLEGKTWEMVAGGFRNPYGIAFNRDGEMFTYDADMEWDAGAPWYRPTRINHIVSGGDYGWRQGVDKWRAWYPDTLPTTYDVGMGSPTTVKFVPSEFFPAGQTNATESLLACEWAYGRLLWIDLEPKGASYVAKQRPFISGRPLNVCDVEFGPDGALYFVIGGRRTQSGLYRVVKLRPEPAIAAATGVKADQAELSQKVREVRHSLEQFHGRVDDKAVGAAWPLLGSDDVWLVHSARVAVEAQPVGGWRKLALEEKGVASALQGLMALARVGTKEDQQPILERLAAFDWKSLSKEQQILLLRIYQLTLIRQGKPTAEEVTPLNVVIGKLYPAAHMECNDLLCELLVYLEHPQVVVKTLPLIDAASSPEEKLHYLMSLRLVKGPWTLEQRRIYFTWLQRAEKFPAGYYLLRFIEYIRQDAIANLSAEDRTALQDVLTPAPVEDKYGDLPSRVFVKDWKLEDFAEELAQPTKEGAVVDAAKGKEMFIAAQCARCHRFQGEGSLVGPELTGVGKRFGKKDLLLHTIEPSRVIDDKYKQVTVTTVDGLVLVGLKVADTEDSLSVITDPTQPSKLTRVERADVEEIHPSLLSPMPAGLLNTLEREDVLILLEYLQQQGK